MEIWKDITEWNSWYQISNTGLVKRKGRIVRRAKFGNQEYPEKILRQMNNGNGYMNVSVGFEGKVYREYIHRLVARYFIENPENKKYVNS